MAYGIGRRQPLSEVMIMLVRNITYAAMLLLSVIGARCTAASREAGCLASAQPRSYSPLIIVNPSSICAPVGVFVAVRRPGWSGVVRFTEQRDMDAGGLEGCSRYELYSRTDPKNQFTRSTGVVSSLGSSGVHPIVVERGNQAITGPGVTLRYMHPGCLSLLVDRALEVAPTPWRTIEEVNLSDARLRWYAVDVSGSRSVTISLDDLATQF